MMEVHGNYYVTTYIQKQTTYETEKEKKKKTILKNNRIVTLLYSILALLNESPYSEKQICHVLNITANKFVNPK